ncbi:MAG: MCE family protein [Planctomycetes bacterium]|nr:MCE family protein [Planctomycetota bacterium]
MATRHNNFELKVGLFAFIVLLILFMIIFSIGDFYLFNPGYTFTVRFNTANGMEIGAPVHVAGVVSGEVKGITVNFKEGKTYVDLLVWIKKATRVPNNSISEIKTLGLLGEKYMDIFPGENPERFLGKGDLLIGDDPISMDNLISKGHDLTSQLEAAAKSFHAILQKIEKGEGTLGKLVVEDKLHRDIEEMVSDIKRHPWKLLRRGRTKDDKRENREKENKSGFFQGRR